MNRSPVRHELDAAALWSQTKRNMNQSELTLPDQTGFVDAEYAAVYPAGIERHYWIHARNRIVHRLLRQSMRETKGPVLEIGCGPGLVTDYMRQRGIECRGCDISIAKPCNQRITDYLEFGVDACELPADFRSSVNYLMMLDVLEHIERPAEFLSRCCGHFPNVRSILITVPARMEVWSNYDVHFRHYKRYDHQSIHELYHPSEFSLRDQGYFFHALYPPARLINLTKTNRKTKLSAPGFAWPHKLVGLAFVIEQIVVPRWVPGTSLFCILDSKSTK